MYKEYYNYNGGGGGGVIGQGASTCDNNRGGSPSLGYNNNDKSSGQYSVDDLLIEEIPQLWLDTTKVEQKSLPKYDWYTGAPGGIIVGVI